MLLLIRKRWQLTKQNPHRQRHSCLLLKLKCSLSFPCVGSEFNQKTEPFCCPLYPPQSPDASLFPPLFNLMTCEPNIAFRPFKRKLLSHREISFTIIMWIANTHPQPRLLRKRRSHSFSHQRDLKSPDSQQRYEAVTGKLHCHCRHSDDLHFNRAHCPKVQDLSGSFSYYTLTY